MSQQLISTVAASFIVLFRFHDSIKFEDADGDVFYLNQEGTLYAVVDDQLMPGCKTVKTMTAINKFIQLRK